MRRLIATAAAVIFAGTALACTAGTAQGARTATPAASCGITWGSLPKSAGALSAAPLVTTRTGQDTCWDRTVFEFDGSATGYRVEYADEVYTEGEGAPLSSITAGGALIGVHLLAPAYDASGRATYPHRARDHVANLTGYQTLRDVVYGGSFEGYTTFAVGTRARLPFRVFVLSGPGTHSRIVVDVAHSW